MKALSIRQPWAELILQGRKTIELRTWQVSYRGRLAIHASQTVDEEACATHGLDPVRVVRGALVGTVNLVGISALDETTWEALRDQHLSLHGSPGPIFGWQLADPQQLPRPIPMPGRMGLFNVPDAIIAGQELPFRATYTVERDTTSPDPEKPFELRVVPDDSSGYSLALYQWPVIASTASTGGSSPALSSGGQRLNSQPTKPECLVSLAGDPLRAVADHVLEALRKSGYKATDLSRERRKPFRLDEETGLRLALLFLTVKPLTRMDRVEAISGALRTMPSEEAYYWFSKCTAGATAINAQKALRILLAGE